MSGKISSHAFRTLSGFNRSLRKVLFARSYHFDHRDHQNHHHDQSDHDGKKFKQRASYCFQFAAAFGVYCGFVQWNDKSTYRVAFCEENLPSKSKSRKSLCGLSMQDAIKESERLLQQLMLRHNCPGLVITVTADGKEIWSKGFGFADVENGIQCTSSTVMRIASISKPVTMAAVAKLWEEKKLDLDRPIQDYVPTWPEKYFEGKKVTMTTRQLVSMLGGVRHYDRECKDLESRKVKAIKSKEDKKKEKSKRSDVKSDEENDGDSSDRKSDKAILSRGENDKQKKKKPKGEEKYKEDESKGNSDDLKPKDKSKKSKQDADHKEFYLKKHFASVTESLNIFKNDDLCCQPGTEYLYSTPAWTLVSAVVEGASGKAFPKVMQELFRELGLRNTFLDDPAAIVQNRARYYVVNKKGKLSNAPYVDNSSKWAGGGLVSTSRDLCQFGNAMLYSFQASSSPSSSFGSKLSFLRPETVKMIWSPVEKTRCSWDSFGFYGMGWGVVPSEEKPRFTREQRQYFSHTGGAVGASSVLLVLPRTEESGSGVKNAARSLPSGVVVAVIVNMQSVGMNQLALDIAKLFERVDDF